MKAKSNFAIGVGVVFAAGLLATGATGQVGKSTGLIDINTADEKTIATLPHLTPDHTKLIISARPYDSIMKFNTLLLATRLTPKQAEEIYAKAFVHINLNTATADEIMLIPGAGKKMAHEFEEYRPWKTWAQFEKEIGKYVGKEETARLAQYCFIPIDANAATKEQLATIPNLPDSAVEQISKGRPWKSIDDLKKELASSAGDKEAARIARYLIVS